MTPSTAVVGNVTTSWGLGTLGRKTSSQNPLHPGLWSEKAPFSHLSEDENKEEMNTEAGDVEGLGGGGARTILSSFLGALAASD